MGQANPSVLVVGGDNKEDARPPNMNVLYKFPAMTEVPFDLNDVDEIKEALYNKFGEGYYRVYAPAHAQRMKNFYKGWVVRDDTKSWRR